MSCFRRTGQLAACALVLLLAGCGGSPVSPSSGTQSSPLLSGNYLLTGSLPTTPASIFSNPSFSIAATFDTIGSQVAAVYSLSIPCSSNIYGFSGGGDLNGAITGDDSFTLQNTLLGGVTVPVQLIIKGVAPTAKGAAWSGTYTLTTTNTVCPGTLTGTVNATPIAAVSGTYTGAASVAPTGSFTGSPVNVSATLQQGTPVTSTFGAVLQTNVSLSGTLSVKGSSCLTSGVPLSTSPFQGGVEGTTVFANFLMNDGSTVEMIGSIGAADSSKLFVNFLTTNAGSCGLSFVSGPVTITH